MASFVIKFMLSADGLSMVIALPHEKEGLTALEKNVEKLLEPQPLKRERVDVKLPQFTIDSEIPFVDILKAVSTYLYYTLLK